MSFNKKRVKMIIFWLVAVVIAGYAAMFAYRGVTYMMLDDEVRSVLGQPMWKDDETKALTEMLYRVRVPTDEQLSGVYRGSMNDEGATATITYKFNGKNRLKGNKKSLSVVLDVERDDGVSFTARGKAYYTMEGSVLVPIPFQVSGDALAVSGDVIPLRFEGNKLHIRLYDKTVTLVK